MVELLDLFPITLDQWLIIKVRKNGQPPKNITMAEPKQIEWVPITSLSMWSTSSLNNATASLNALVI
jgi:hypothetical protein